MWLFHSNGFLALKIDRRFIEVWRDAGLTLQSWRNLVKKMNSKKIELTPVEGFGGAPK
jgi:hypothetical protein